MIRNMKSNCIKLVLCILLTCCCPIMLMAQEEVDLKSTNSNSTIGIIGGYNESIVRDVRNYYYPDYFYKEVHPDKFRGYSIGVSFNKKLQDSDGFSTLTLEALIQTLPMFYESYFAVLDTVFGDYYPSRMVSNHASNTMATLNSLYNINLFNSGFSLSFGGSIAYIFNKQYKKTVEIDSTILRLIETKSITPLEPVVFGKEIEFEPDSPMINPIRFAVLVGLNYNFTFQNTEIEPFIRYTHSLNRQSRSYTEDLLLHGLQTGIAVRFPL